MALWGYALASIAGSLLGNSMTNKANIRNTRENNAHQLRMSNTAHQREVKDLRSAGLNPILSSRSSGAPQPASAAAKVEPYNINPSEKLVQANQIELLKAQTKKTRAEAVNTELLENYNKALSDVYGSVLGEPAVGLKTLGTAGSAVGMYQGARYLSRMLKARKLKNATFSKSKSVSKFIRSRGGSKSRLQQSKSLRSRAFAPEKDLGKAFNRSYKTFGRFGRFRR